ncbi:MAG: YggS family pyridoxal phosphate-dependent enzyme [Alphaproteobacteria bacterium]|nr:YggS family pyridoxal phosphate-dependent enzyme [Alphaproteobacteria bacterium]
MPDVSSRIASIHSRMAKAATKAKRKPNSVKLIAVSKLQPPTSVEEAIKSGQKAFGENRVQEAEEKFAPLREKHPHLELHLIGHLQTNKALSAVKLFDVIQTLDREDLAVGLAKAIKKTGRAPQLYIEVNLGREEQKAGIYPEELENFIYECREKHGLEISGLMCIPPIEEDPIPHFTKLKELADKHRLHNISMGMSADFEEAISCGATEIRIGTAIFGERAR